MRNRLTSIKIIKSVGPKRLRDRGKKFAREISYILFYTSDYDRIKFKRVWI